MSVLEGIRNDLKQHRNLDIYLTIVTALIVSALSFFDLVPAGEVTSLLLAVLAVLAFSALQTRTAAEGATFQQDHSPQFLADFPADLRTSREQAMDWFRSSYGCTITPR